VHNKLLLRPLQQKRESEKNIHFFVCYAIKRLEVTMKDIFLLLIILVIWFVVNKYILPKMGVPT